MRADDAGLHGVLLDAEHVVTEALLALDVRIDTLRLLLAPHVASNLRFYATVGLQRALAALSVRSCANSDVGHRLTQDLSPLVLVDVSLSRAVGLRHEVDALVQRDALLERSLRNHFFSWGLALLRAPSCHTHSLLLEMLLIYDCLRLIDKVNQDTS